MCTCFFAQFSPCEVVPGCTRTPSYLCVCMCSGVDREVAGKPSTYENMSIACPSCSLLFCSFVYLRAHTSVYTNDVHLRIVCAPVKTTWMLWGYLPTMHRLSTYSTEFQPWPTNHLHNQAISLLLHTTPVSSTSRMDTLPPKLL